MWLGITKHAQGPKNYQPVLPSQILIFLGQWRSKSVQKKNRLVFFWSLTVFCCTYQVTICLCPLTINLSDFVAILTGIKYIGKVWLLLLKVWITFYRTHILYFAKHQLSLIFARLLHLKRVVLNIFMFKYNSKIVYFSRKQFIFLILNFLF